MAKEYINHRDCETAEDLADAISILIDDACSHAGVIHITRPVRLTLEEDTLTDGSVVKNIMIGFVD